MKKKAAERVETERLILRRPTVHDAAAVFARYASDVEVSRYLAAGTIGVAAPTSWRVTSTARASLP